MYVILHYTLFPVLMEKTFLLIVLSFDKQIHWKLKYYLIHVFLMVEEKWFNNNAKIIILLIIILNLLINN